MCSENKSPKPSTAAKLGDSAETPVPEEPEAFFAPTPELQKRSNKVMPAAKFFFEWPPTKEKSDRFRSTKIFQLCLPWLHFWGKRRKSPDGACQINAFESKNFLRKNLLFWAPSTHQNCVENSAEITPFPPPPGFPITCLRP